MRSRNRIGICILGVGLAIVGAIVLSVYHPHLGRGGPEVSPSGGVDQDKRKSVPAARDAEKEVSGLDESATREQDRGGLQSGDQIKPTSVRPLPRDITAELSKLEDVSTNIKLAENVEGKERARSILKGVRLAWAECQDLINSGRVAATYWNGSYSALYKPEGGPGALSFVFGYQKGEILQCKKWAVFPEGGRVGQREYELAFYENGKPRSCTLSPKNERAYFYPSGAVQSLYFETPDGNAHTLTWREDGSFDAHRQVKKADFPKFFGGTDVNKAPVP